MKRYRNQFFLAAIAMFAASTGLAQQPLPAAAPAPGAAAPAPPPPMFGVRGPKSPEIAPDGSAIFRLRAPDATTVGVSGSWQVMMSPPLPMTKGDDGIWTLTVTGLKPEMWTYNFVVNGVRMLDPGNVDVMRDGVRFLSVLTIPGPGSATYLVANVPHGTVEQIWYPSPTLNMTARRMYVYTPAGYETGTQRYPVFYLLHGGGGDEDAWDSMGRALEILDNLIAAGKAMPMIVVMPNGNWNQTAAPGITAQAETPFGGPGADRAAAMRAMMANSAKFGDSIVADVIPFVDRTFRTIPDSDHRALAGLSMGGGQSLSAGLAHLDQFSYIATFSGAVVMLPGAMKIVPVPPGSAARGPGAGQELDTSALSADFPRLKSDANQRLRLLYISCGENDGLLKSNQQFMDWLSAQGIPYKKFVLPGYAHEWPFWRLSLSDLLPQLFNQH